MIFGAISLIAHYNGCFFKFGVEAGVELSIVNALYRLRITDQRFKSYTFTRVVRSQSTLQRLLRRQIKKKTPLYLPSPKGGLGRKLDFCFGSIVRIHFLFDTVRI
jgi:hypothetical protein